MGFFSDLMKNPLVQMAMPMALSWAMPQLGITGLMSGIKNPMMRSAIEQGLLGYGSAALTGSKHPEKAAMYAGLGSMPFSFMKASNAANLYNEQLAGDKIHPDLFKTERFMSHPGWEATAKQSPFHPAVAAKAPQFDYRVPDQALVDKFYKASQQKELTPWDIISGTEDKLADVIRPPMRDMKMIDMAEGPRRPKWNYYDDLEKPDMATLPQKTFSTPEVDFYSKVGTGEKNLLGGTLKEGKEYTDWLPTIASQSAGLYGGRATDEELWEDAKARRRKELAFMYGIPEELMGGEMENPYYTGGGFWKDGGIATLEMDSGGAVNGPGGPKDDVIDAKLSDGEFVMTAKAVENLGGGDRMAGAKRMYNMMNQLDPESETVQESVIGV